MIEGDGKSELNCRKPTPTSTEGPAEFGGMKVIKDDTMKEGDWRFKKGVVHSAAPALECTCASFFTVRGYHKSDCPLNKAWGAVPALEVEERTKYKPVYPVLPGDTVVEVLKEKGMTQKRFCKLANRPEKWLSEITHGKARITVESALQFEEVLGIEAEFWLNLQQQFDLIAARGRIALNKLPS